MAKILTSHRQTISSSGGVVLANRTVGFSCVPTTTHERIRIRNNPCKILVLSFVKVLSGFFSFLLIKSNKMSSADWITIPPRMFPTAKSVFPLMAPLKMIAVSGRFVTTERMMVPPNALPNLNFSSIKSTMEDSLLQKYQSKKIDTLKISRLMLRDKFRSISMCEMRRFKYEWHYILNGRPFNN